MSACGRFSNSAFKRFLSVSCQLNKSRILLGSNVLVVTSRDRYIGLWGPKLKEVFEYFGIREDGVQQCGDSSSFPTHETRRVNSFIIWALRSLGFCSESNIFGCLIRGIGREAGGIFIGSSSKTPAPIDFLFNSSSRLLLSCPISLSLRFMGTFKTLGLLLRCVSSSRLLTISWNLSPRTLFSFEAKLSFHFFIFWKACCSISDAYLEQSARGEPEASVALRPDALAFHNLTAASTVWDWSPLSSSEEKS